jgi:hypothetical protein
MTKEDFERLEQNLNLPKHTPLSHQIELLKGDALKLIAEVMRLRNDLHAANRAQVALVQELQASADESYAAGANAMRQSVIEACCPACSEAVIQLTNERPLQ